MQAFKVGDVVMLRSADFVMTIEEVSETGDRVSCVWFDVSHQLRKAVFKSECLSLMEEIEEEDDAKSA